MGRKRADGNSTSFRKGRLVIRLSRSALILLILTAFGVPTVPAASSIESLVAKARVRIKRGDVKGALALAEKVRSLDPDSADAYFLAGSVAKLTDDLDAAYEWLAKAVEIDPSRYMGELSRDLADLAIQVAQSSRSRYHRRELLEDALWYLDQKTEPAPDPSELLLEKVKLLLVLDRPAEAKALCVERNTVSADKSALACLRELLSSAEATAADTAVRTVHPAGHDELVSLPIIWWKVRPVFPELARVARIEGRVVIQVLVSQDGAVTDLEVLECNRPGLGFEESALLAVEQWRYLPAMKDGEPVAVYFTVRVDFELE